MSMYFISLQDNDRTVWMQCDILFTIDQLWLRFSEVSGLYVDERSLIIMHSRELNVNAILKSSSPSQNLLSLDTHTKKLSSFSVMVSYWTSPLFLY